MTPERWQQIDKLLERALEQEPDRRGVFLDEACQGDTELRREVESLLSAHGKVEGFTEAGPMRKPARRTGVEELELLSGRQIGHYQILSRLGEGGMGIVYKARDRHLDRFVAIKVLPPELVADPDRKRRFVQEAKAASALNHPNIITIHDIASDNGTDFIVMEYVQGKTLGQLIPRRGLKLNEVLKYAIQIADALAKAQAAGIIHRDLKPGNIMVDEGGLVKVLDFGLAKLTERSQVGEEEPTRTALPWTEEGIILGTASYMSPEQAAGRPVDSRSDIFSFGSVLYEMVTGQRAFQGDSKMSTLAAVLNQEPKPASEISRALPRDLEKIITRCLRKDPSRRFQHIADLKVALEELKEESDSGLLGVKEATDSSGKPRRFSQLRRVALAVAGVGLAVAAWFWLSRFTTGQPEAVFTTVPLTTYPGHERSPSFSPDGNQVVFSWNGQRQDNFDIYVKLVGSDDQPLQLTRDPADDTNPVWSPDGRWIAFLRDLGKGRAAVLRVSPIGGQDRKLSELDKSWYGFGSPLAWSPAGDSLVIVDRESDSEPYGLFVLSLESGQKRRLTSPPPLTRGDGGPAFSPDGHTMAFVRTLDFGSVDLYLLTVAEDLSATGEPKRLNLEQRDLNDPAWTPEGREVIFSNFGVGSIFSFGHLWRVKVSGSDKARQLPVGENGAGFCISRQRHRLVYSREVLEGDIWRVSISGSEAKKSVSERFIFSTQSETNPQISPNGKKVVFSSDRSGTVEIWICDHDGSNPMQLTSSGKGQSASPRWSPDSRRISFDSNAEGQFEVYEMDAYGGRPQRLTTHLASDAVPSWSRDGKWIYFASNRSGTYQVWKMPVSGGQALQVTQKGGFLPIESFDAKSVYYMKGYNDRQIWRVPSEGGEESEVLGPIFRRDYDVTQDGIYFISEADASKSQSLQFFSFTGGTVKSVASIENPWGHFISVSPDSRWILYPKLHLEGSDLMLVENFR